MNFKDLPETGGSKWYLKLKDKESVAGVFRGNPHEFYVVWENGKSNVVDESNPDGKFRFRINFVVKEGDNYAPKIFENSRTVYEMLKELSKEYDLETTVIKITRSGSGTDTTYSLLPLLKQALTPEATAHLAGLQLLELAPKTAPPQSMSERLGVKNHAPAGVDTSEELPF